MQRQLLPDPGEYRNVKGNHVYAPETGLKGGFKGGSLQSVHLTFELSARFVSRNVDYSEF